MWFVGGCCESGIVGMVGPEKTNALAHRLTHSADNEWNDPRQGHFGLGALRELLRF